MTENNDHLKIPQKFWLVIGSAILSGVIAFTTLTMRVNAMDAEVADTEETNTRLELKIDLLLEKMIEMQIEQSIQGKSIEYIESSIIVVQAE